MVRLEPGTVVWIAFPYADGEHAKPRPALLLRECGPSAALFCMITTHSHADRLEKAIPEHEKKRVQMKVRESVLRLDTLFTLDKSAATSPWGKFSPGFLEEVKAALRQWL